MPNVKNTTTVLVLLVLFSASACRKPPAPETKSAAEGTAQQTPAAEAAPQPPKPMPTELPDVLARVNGEPVRKVEFDRVLRNMELGNGPVPAEKRDEVLRGVLDQLITYTVMTQEAKAKNVTVSDAEVDTRIQQMKGTGSEAQFKKALEARSMSVEQLRSDARVQLTIEKMMEAHVAGTEAATDAEALQFYESNPDKFKQGDTVRASHILLRVDGKAAEADRKQARARIEAILKQARSGDDFAALAQKHSQDGSAQAGGDLGYFERGEMVPAFSQAAFSLKPGEMSDVVTTEFGYHIIKVTDRKAAATVPYEQVSRQIVEFLSGRKKQERAAQFIDEAKKRARIEVLV